MRAPIRLLWMLALPLLAQEPTPSSQQTTPPEASPSSVLTRAVQMYDSRNYVAALPAFQQAARGGLADAMMYLGVMFAQGQGTRVDFAQAVNWFQKAADLGVSQAMCNLGSLYYQGAGVTRKYDEALRWFNRCATAGNEQGMYNLAVMYRDGTGVNKKIGRAHV